MIESIVKGMVSAFLEFLGKKSKEQSTVEDGQRVGDLEKKLKEKIKKDTKKTLCVLILLLFSFSGCATHTIYVPQGKAVQVRNPIKNARIWVFNSRGIRVPGRMDIPAGWYILPLPVEPEIIEEEDNEAKTN